MKEHFFCDEEALLIKEFQEKGYVKAKVKDFDLLDLLRDKVVEFLKSHLNITQGRFDNETLLNNLHNHLSQIDLNTLRVDLINYINSQAWLRPTYYSLGSELINAIVGNELAMQRRVNISIQAPSDSSSLLAMHADTWSGDSPYEVVMWLPFVDCYKTKSMYILPAHKLKDPLSFFDESTSISSDELFKEYEDDLVFLDVNYGEILVFNQALPHGNIVNKESECRLTMNCRFKGLFTPYHDKTLGEFFEPITMRPISQLGIDYSRYIEDE